MHVLLTGGTGFIGAALLPALLAEGHRLTVLSRQAREPRPDVQFVRDFTAIDEPVDAVINLAGESLAARRWTPAYKQQMLDSRVGVTDRLTAWMGTQPKAPGVLLSGSAIGYYGASEVAVFDEDSPPGAGFAAALCQQWESAALLAETPSTRVVLMRLGVVLDREGGALTEMARSFRFGVGSWLGDGAQWLSWIHRWDVVRAILFLLDHAEARGAFNVVAPNPVSHREFCEALSARQRVLFQTAVPAPLVRALVGEMADELLLQGQQVLPRRLLEFGYSFAFPSLDGALLDIRSKGSPLRQRR